MRQGIIGQKKASRAIGEVVNDDRADWREAWALFPGSVAYIWHAGTKAGIAFRIKTGRSTISCTREDRTKAHRRRGRFLRQMP